MNGDFIIFKNWPKNYRHFNKAYINHYTRKMKLINKRISKAIERIKDAGGKL